MKARCTASTPRPTPELPPVQRLVQLSLDLFDALAAPLRDWAATPAGSAPDLAAVQGGAKGAPGSSPSRAARPGQAGPADLLLSSFAHALSNREILLNGCRVGYEFKRGRRRTIGFQVGPRGLEVRAPRWVGRREVDEALREKSAWILRKLQEMQERGQRLQLSRIEWSDGSSFPYLGEPLLLVIDPRHEFDGIGAARQVDNATLPGVPRATLHVGLSHSASPQQIGDAVQAWLMRSARQHFSQRLAHFAPSLGVSWRRLSLSSASTRWGSAGADGSIRLNWRLIHFRPEVIDYVVVHELSHLKVMDHSPRFWRTVEAMVPDFATLRAELLDESLPQW